MKRFLSVLLVLVMLASITGCSSAVSYQPLPEDEQDIGGGVLSGNSSIIYGDDEDSLSTKYPGGIIGGDSDFDEDTSDTKTTENVTSSTQSENKTSSTSQTTRPSHSTTKPTEDDDAPAWVDPSTCKHDFKVVSFEDSTCAKMGKKVSYCAKCDTTRTENVYKKTTHTGGKATCKARAVCTICKQPYGELADHYCDNDNGYCTTAAYCDTCGTLMRAAGEHVWVKSCIADAFCLECPATSEERGDHVYSSNGTCYYCPAKDPNHSGSSGGNSGGNSGNSSAQISWVYTVFPVDISYGTITSATAEVSGTTLTLRINMTRNTILANNKSMKAYYRISDSSFDTVATGSYSSSSLGPGESTTVTVNISDVITSSGKYYVFLSSTEPLY